MSSGLYKKIKFDEEFSFKSDFQLETFNLCCLFWKTFEEYDQKIISEQFNYSYFEFIIFQLNIYIQQHNLSHHELYRIPSNEAGENQAKGSLLNTNMLANNNEQLNFQFSTGNFGNLNYFDKSSIFSVVSMVYGDKNNNSKQNDERIIINFGSLEYPLPLITKSSPKNSPNNSTEYKFNSNNSNNSSSSLREEVFQFDDKISPVAETPLKSKSLPLPSYRVIDDDDLDNCDDEDDDEEDDCNINKSKNNNNNNNNDDNNKNIIIALDKLTEDQKFEKEDVNQRVHMFQMAKQQYLSMLENKDQQHRNCNYICHQHCHHYSFANLRILYKLKELFVNHANDMLKFRKYVK